MTMTREESTRRGRGKWCERREANTTGRYTKPSKTKSRAVVKAKKSDDVDPNKPVNIVFLFVFERKQAAPVYAHTIGNF